jgi:hypothetical protein
LRMIAKRFHRPVDHSLTANFAVLLGTPGARAQSAAGCDKDGCSSVRSGHFYSMKGAFRVALGALLAAQPLSCRRPKTERFPVVVGKAVFLHRRCTL